MIIDIIEDHLNEALQKDVRFTLNGKILREGRLMLYNIKDFYITFTIMTKKDIVKTYEIPIPFKISKSEKDINLSYMQDHLVKGNKKIKMLISDIYGKIGKKSKFHNNVLVIESD